MFVIKKSEEADPPCYTLPMRDATPEPGFIPAYRFFIVIRILFWLAVGPVLHPAAAGRRPDA